MVSLAKWRRDDLAAVGTDLSIAWCQEQGDELLFAAADERNNLRPQLLRLAGTQLVRSRINLREPTMLATDFGRSGFYYGASGRGLVHAQLEER